MLKELLYFMHYDIPQVQHFTGVVTSVFNKYRDENDIKLTVYEIEDSETQDLMIKYNIQAVPAIVFLNENGEFIRKITGAVPANDLEIYINYDLNETVKLDKDMKKDKTIVCFSGRAHNGKTMLSEHLVNNNGFERLSVAHALKKLCASVLGFPNIEEMNNHKTEEKEYILKDVDIKFLSNESGVPLDFVKQELDKVNNTLTSVRHALQYIGTDIFRKYDADWHVKQLKKEIEASESDKIVIDDIRFMNEYELMKEMEATMIFIVRPVIQNVSHHKSDEELDWKMFDKVIINDSTPNYAIEQMTKLIETGFNKAFDEEVLAYEELDLEGKDVIADNDTTIKIMKDGKLEQKYHIYGNTLIIEDLKRKLRYVDEKDQKTQ